MIINGINFPEASIADFCQDHLSDMIDRDIDFHTSKGSTAC